MLRRTLGYLVLLTSALLAACHGGGGGGAGPITPVNLEYRDSTASYVVGEAIPPNQPHVAGGTLSSYEIKPRLPDGLSLDPTTGVISGTPLAASNATTYRVTGTGANGSAQAELRIAVADRAAPLISLNYAQKEAVYVVGTPISENRPNPTGVVETYSISPPLPAGLTFSTDQGIVSGTPTETRAAADYTVTAVGLPSGLQNSRQTVVEHLTITVEDGVPPAPTGLRYQRSWAVYAKGEPILSNTAFHDGGPIDTYAAQSLPAGLSIDSATGDIFGTPTVTTTTDQTVTIDGTGPGGTVSTTVKLRVVEPRTWTKVPGLMSSARYTSAQVALQDGRVLVIGGQSSGTGALDSAEIYDPNTGQFSPAGRMSAGRTGMTATVLPSGKVLVAGGRDAAGATVNSAEIFDPMAADPSQAWQPTPPMSEPRHDATLAVRSDGRVIAIGGGQSPGGSTGTVLGTTDIFTPPTESSGTNGSWSPGPTLLQPITSAAALAMEDGDQLVAPCGLTLYNDYRSASASAAVSSNPWTAWTNVNLAQGRRSQCGVWTASPDTALVFGGLNDAGVTLNTVERYDASAKTWVAMPGFQTARRLPLVAPLSGDSVLIAGGSVGPLGSRGTNAAEIYTFDPVNPGNSSAVAVGPMSAGRAGGGASALPDGTVLVVGGWDNFGSGTYWTTAELFVP